MNCLPIVANLYLRITAFISLGILAAAASAQTIITFDVPNSTYTVPQAINFFGQITGYYEGANDVHGFLRRSDGKIETFNIEVYGRPWTTFATDINPQGQITGYVLYPRTSVGFIRNRDGRVVIFPSALSGAAAAGEPAPPTCCEDGTTPLAINELGQITGSLGQGTYAQTGFLRQPDGTFLNFNANSPPPFFTIPQDLTLYGEIVGYYRDSDDTTHGFLREGNGAVTTFDPPGSVNTEAKSINLHGQITGFYTAGDGTYHGFLRRGSGAMLTFDPAGSVSTQAIAINIKGQITGFYATADGVYHGFLRRIDGKIDSFDVPGVGNKGTFPRDINDRSQIVGYYQDMSFALHGFIRSVR